VREEELRIIEQRLGVLLQLFGEEDGLTSDRDMRANLGLRGDVRT
jgi:hypothetical protein